MHRLIDAQRRGFDPHATSLAWHSDLLFARFAGEVSPREDCLVVRTPTDPTFYWGNFLLVQQPPGDADFDGWMARFDAEIGAHDRATQHVAFGLDVIDATLPPSFARAGFELIRSTVLALSAEQLIHPRKAVPAGFEPRPLRLPQEIGAAVDLQVRTEDTGFEPHGYRVHREARMAGYAAMDAAGLGRWFGVWHRDALVADCGLFTGDTPEARIARFQHVETHPEFRRKGLCSALVHHACRYGFERLGVNRIVMCADPDDVAIGIYRSLGFSPLGTQWHLQRRAPADRGRLTFASPAP